MFIKFVDRLKLCRERKDVTQQVVADYLGMTVTSYQRYELGTREPKLDQLVKLADYFNVSVDYLLGRSDDPYSHIIGKK